VWFQPVRGKRLGRAREEDFQAKQLLWLERVDLDDSIERELMTLIWKNS
jgi:hypothetical protein